ncbi:MAG: tetratricopeptide repeat protein [Pirellulaceae bacterium]|nr:tetratricopeptide repeat protein [Pirellulaceae bacterium]
MSARQAARTVLLAIFAAAGGCASFGGGPSPSASSSAYSAAGAKDASPDQRGVRPASFEEADEEQEGLGLSDFSLTNLNKTTKKLTGYGPNKDVAKQAYLEADAIYRRAAAAEGAERIRLFTEAAPKFEQAAARFPDSALAMDAMFMVGECHFFADNYPKANDAYEKLIKAFPNNRYLDTVGVRRFTIARYWVERNKQTPEPFYYANFTDKTRPWRDMRGHGLRIFDKIRIDDPTGRLSDDATLAAANENFAAGKFMKADEYYSDLRKAYPTSEHQFLAHFLGLKAKLNSYMGPAYGGSALDEGEKLLKQMRRQFPVESEKEREYLDRAAAEIRYLKAQRLEFLAKYYDNRSEYRAAQGYYERIVSDFGDTPIAERSQERITQIAGLPPKPAQQAQWLVDLLPQSDKVKPLLEATQREREIEAQQQQQSVENIAQQPPVGTPAQAVSVPR